jgi:hypothetical protein
MNTRHTPGPWYFTVQDEPNTMQVESDTCTGIIASDIRKTANARLIASAPDLLAMLERVCDALSHRLDRDENSAALTEARTALERAKQ